MKLADIAKKIDKSKINESEIDITDFSTEFNCDFKYVDQDRLKAYYIGNWCCTDSWVGWRMYFFDEEPVAFSFQPGRKCDQEFEWFSKEKALKVRDYLLSLMSKDDEELGLNFRNINDDIGEGFKIQFNNQIINPDKATYNGEQIYILERIKDDPDYGIDQNLKIKLKSGEEKVVNIKDLDFKFNLEP